MAVLIVVASVRMPISASIRFSVTISVRICMSICVLPLFIHVVQQVPRELPSCKGFADPKTCHVTQDSHYSYEGDEETRIEYTNSVIR